MLEETMISAIEKNFCRIVGTVSGRSIPSAFINFMDFSPEKESKLIMELPLKCLRKVECKNLWEQKPYVSAFCALR